MQITPISRTVGQDRVRVPPSSVPPKVFEPVGRHFGIPDRVLNVLVPKVVLQGPRVVAIIGQLEPAGMAQHVGVDREWHLRGFPEALDKPVETDGTDWAAALGNEHVGVLRVIPSYFTQSPHLVTADRMYAGNPVLDTVNVQAALGQLDLLPLQVADLRCPQTVAIGDQDHGRVAMPIAAVLARAVHQSLDLAFGEVAPLDCQVYDAWGAFLGSRFHRGETLLLHIE